MNEIQLIDVNDNVIETNYLTNMSENHNIIVTKKAYV